MKNTDIYKNLKFRLCYAEYCDTCKWYSGNKFSICEHSNVTLRPNSSISDKNIKCENYEEMNRQCKIGLPQ